MDMFWSIKSFTTVSNRMYRVLLSLHNFTAFTLQVKESTETSVIIDGPHTFTLENETNTFVVITGLQSGLTYEFLVRVPCTNLSR